MKRISFLSQGGLTHPSVVGCEQMLNQRETRIRLIANKIHSPRMPIINHSGQIVVFTSEMSTRSRFKLENANNFIHQPNSSHKSTKYSFYFFVILQRSRHSFREDSRVETNRKIVDFSLCSLTRHIIKSVTHEVAD